MHAQKYTRLLLSGVEIPAGSDMDIREAVTLISEASDMRRTVNGDLTNLSRAIFRKYRISISADDLFAAGVHGVAPGDYVECVPTEPFSISVPSPAAAVELPRAGIEVVGLTSDGRRVQPVSQPADPLPLTHARQPSRVAALRARPTVTFPEPVVLVRFRPVLACLVVDWSSDADERQATASWGLTLEEV